MTEEGDEHLSSFPRTRESILTFLSDSLALWNIEGSVARSDGLLVVQASGLTISIERTDQAPFRWLVHVNDRPRPRRCASLLGVLSALRAALGVDRGAPLRVAAAPPEARA